MWVANLTTQDRALLGFFSLLLNPRRLVRAAIIVKPSTLLSLHNAPKKRKSIPYVPMSHPFVERLIGSIRRELLDHTLFWTATDLENKLRNYQRYYNKQRTHSGRAGAIPVELADRKIIEIENYRGEKHCRGLFELPVAA